MLALDRTCGAVGWSGEERSLNWKPRMRWARYCVRVARRWPLPAGGLGARKEAAEAACALRSMRAMMRSTAAKMGSLPGQHAMCTRL